MQETNPGEEPPKDKYKAVYSIMLLHGVAILMPWNMFITPISYFVDYKMSRNYTGEESYYATYFLQSVGFASQVPNLFFNWINVFINFRGGVTPRIVLTICTEVVLFMVTIILGITDTSDSASAFFWSTMVIIVILNMSNGIYENTIFRIAAQLHATYPGAVILGCNISGSLVSFINLLTNILAPSIKTAAIYYFVTALVVLLVSLLSYFLLKQIRFYKYYVFPMATPRGEGRTRSDGKIPYWSIFKSAFSQLFNVFFVFFVTYSIFPAMQSNIKKSRGDFIVPEKYYINVMCYITFNTAAMLGCTVSNWIDWPSPKALLIPVLLRGFFIPFFFFCNYQPTNKVRKVPVLISNDWVYWIAGILMGFTSGYLSTKAFIYTAGSVEAAYASISGMFGAAFISTGIFFAVIFSMIFPCLTEV